MSNFQEMNMSLRKNAGTLAAAAVLGLAGCGYDTNNQNSPNSTQVGTNTANPTP